MKKKIKTEYVWEKLIGEIVRLEIDKYNVDAHWSNYPLYLYETDGDKLYFKRAEWELVEFFFYSWQIKSMTIDLSDYN